MGFSFNHDRVARADGAAREHAGKNALALCTVSDHLLTGEETSAAERQTSFTDMMELALKTAEKLA